MPLLGAHGFFLAQSYQISYQVKNEEKREIVVVLQIYLFIKLKNFCEKSKNRNEKTKKRKNEKTKNEKTKKAKKAKKRKAKNRKKSKKEGNRRKKQNNARQVMCIYFVTS